jgi:hypothetical protein
MNLIDGLKIELSSHELKTTLLERYEHHKGKASFYASQVSAMGKQGIEQQHVTNDPVASLKASQRSHEERTAFFRFLADHVIPESIYRLTEHDLTRLELLSRYL